jgi:hypothetical protein
MYFLCCICLFSNSQNIMTANSIIAEVKCIETISTGKAHNSFFFLFKIEEIIKGEFNDSIVCSQEIYSDFGGKQIREKLTSGDRIVLKFESSTEDEAKEYLKGRTDVKAVELKWASETSRIESFYRLEEKLPLTNGTENTWVELLKEEKGKLFYKEKGVEKIAVEILPGYWITATVDK